MKLEAKGITPLFKFSFLDDRSEEEEESDADNASNQSEETPKIFTSHDF